MIDAAAVGDKPDPTGLSCRYMPVAGKNGALSCRCSS